MATEKQKAANRRNAQKSTGPTSIEGKSKSSKNALKHGLYSKSATLDPEDQAERQRLAAACHEEFAPANDAERELVDTLALNAWLARRYRSIDAKVWNDALRLYDTEAHGPRLAAKACACSSNDLGAIFIQSSSLICRVDRYKNSAQRNYQKALRQLLQLRDQRGEKAMPEPPAEPAVNEPLNHKSASFHTFSQPIAMTPPATLRHEGMNSQIQPKEDKAHGPHSAATRCANPNNAPEPQIPPTTRGRSVENALVIPAPSITTLLTTLFTVNAK